MAIERPLLLTNDEVLVLERMIDAHECSGDEEDCPFVDRCYIDPAHIDTKVLNFEEPCLSALDKLSQEAERTPKLKGARRERIHQP